MVDVLTSGIIFSLIAEMRFSEKHKSRRMNNESDGCTAGKIFDAMTGIIGKKYGEKSVAKNTVSTFRNCSEGQGGKGLNKKECWDLFNCGMKDHYDALISRTEAALQECVINDKAIRNRFVANALYMIKHAQNCISTTKFIYGDQILTRDELLGLKEIDFVKFLLAVWHNAIVNTPNNTLGNEFYKKHFQINNRGQTESVFIHSKQAAAEFQFNLINWQSPEKPIMCYDSEFADETVIPEAVIFGPENAPTDKAEKRIIYNNGIYVESNDGTINLSFGRDKQ